MPEPITEVWVWVTNHPNGRVAGASLNGPGSSIHDMLARGASRETIAASEGLFAEWMQDKTLHRYEWNGYTLQRLPLATPEMVKFMDAARAFVHAQRRSGFGTNAMMPYWHHLEEAERATGHQPRILGLPVVLDPTIPVSKLILRSGESEVHADGFVIDAARAAGGTHG